MNDVSKKLQENDIKLVLHGRPVADTALLAWGLGSIARAILFYAEGLHLKNSLPSRAISAYYALFHLTAFCIYAAPEFITKEQYKKIRDKMPEGCDPSKAIFHKDAEKFLNKCIGHNMPSKILELFTTLSCGFWTGSR